MSQLVELSSGLHPLKTARIEFYICRIPPQTISLLPTTSHKEKSFRAMATRNVTALPNPFTPMAYLTPSLATKITNQNYVAVGSSAVGCTTSILKYVLNTVCNGRLFCGTLSHISTKIIDWRQDIGSIFRL